MPQRLPPHSLKHVHVHWLPCTHKCAAYLMPALVDESCQSQPQPGFQPIIRPSSWWPMIKHIWTYVNVRSATGLHQGTDLVSQTCRPPSSWKQRSWRNQEQDCSQPGQCAGKRSWLQWSLWLDSRNSWELRGISRTIAAATNISKFRCANLWHWPSKTGGWNCCQRCFNCTKQRLWMLLLIFVKPIFQFFWEISWTSMQNAAMRCQIWPAKFLLVSRNEWHLKGDSCSAAACGLQHVGAQAASSTGTHSF